MQYLIFFFEFFSLFGDHIPQILNQVCTKHNQIHDHTSEIRGLRSNKVSRHVTQLNQSQFICRLWKYDSFYCNCSGFRDVTWHRQPILPKSAGKFCPCLTGHQRPEQLQKNESYFHNLHTNWDQFSYATCLDTFFDLKLRTTEVCFFNKSKRMIRCMPFLLPN